MSSNSKVVHLNSQNTSAKKSEKPRYGRQPALLQDLQERGKQRLMSLLYDMFDNTDDALFELADKADSNAVQNLFFESMREVRIKRRGIENCFSQNIEEAFRRIGDENYRGDGLDEPVTLASVSEESLSLVAQDELEEVVATDSMVSKAMSLYPIVLSQLTIRINKVAPAKVDLRSNPLGPSVICQGFVEGCESLEIDIKAKLVLYKLFDRYVISRMGNALDDGNQLLISAGILPHLKSDSPANRKRQQIRTDGLSSPQDEDVFSGLQSLLSSTVAAVPMQGAGGLLPMGQAPAMPRPMIMDLLSELQHQQVQQGQGQGYANAEANCFNVASLLDGVLVAQNPGQSHSLGKVDDDVINLVQMLFQFILDDRNLASEMKAIISSLQIPLVKVAMQDRTFFSRGGHPARKLLNEIATTALGWLPPEEGQHDPLLNKVEEVVSRVLNEYASDMDVFQELLTDFISFLEIEKRRVGLVERRTVDAEDGRAKSEAARAAVQKVIEGKMAGKCLPDVVVNLLRDAWSNVLFLVYLKEGEESEEWQLSISVVDELLWSVDLSKSVERQELLKKVPAILKSLREGLAKISYNPFDMNTMFSELEAEHLKRLKGQDSLAEAAMEAVKPVVAIAETADQQLENACAEIKENIYQKVDAMTIGTWVEFHPSDDNTFRCRLAAVIKPTGKYIFVNRSGKKVAEQTREGLAIDIQSGAISLLDDGLLFDRALESVIGNLRDLKGPK